MKGMDVSKMLQQVQQMQAEMAKAQEELATETVEASVGGGMVVVKASGTGEITEIKISPDAIDPDDPSWAARWVASKAWVFQASRHNVRACSARSSTT